MKPVFLTFCTSVLLMGCVDHYLPCRSVAGLWEEEKISLELSFAETACDPDSKTGIRFSDVNDSRCPEGYFCIWAGEARVSLEIIQDEQVTGSFDVTLGEQKEFEVNRQLFIFTLRSVTPNPRTDKTEKHQYRINLEVEKK